MKRRPVDPREALKAAAQRKALRALRKAERLAAKTGVDLSDWEGEFLSSAAERVKTYGRAFADPEKGAPGQALSVRQAVKLKEISAKAAGKEQPRRFRRSRRDKSTDES